MFHFNILAIFQTGISGNFRHWTGDGIKTGIAKVLDMLEQSEAIVVSALAEDCQLLSFKISPKEIDRCEEI